MSSELIKNNSVCNYAMLSRYYGDARLNNTLNNIPVSYPVMPMYQVVPIFAATGDYSVPNYNTLTKGSCFNYAGINQAYVDCSDPNSSQMCAMTGGQCVVYKKRDCAGPAVVAPPSYYAQGQQCFPNYAQLPDLNASPARYGSITSCMASAGSGSDMQLPVAPVQPFRPLPPNGFRPTMAPTMGPTSGPSMAQSLGF